MDWKLLLMGALMAVLGGFIVFRFRKSNFNRQLGAACFMTGGILLLMIGVIASAMSFLIHI